jgi:YHS domain-containing protein
MLRILFFIALLFSGSAFGQLEYNTISEGADKLLMMRGKDPVSYFQGAEPVMGNPGIKAEHGGVTYRFASEENKKLFLANPEKYVPMYGGHCSNGMAYAIGGSYGENHRIIDGKLYLFGGEKSRAYFEMDLEKNKKLADHYWATEYKGKNWREVSSRFSRWGNRVDHYKTNRELAREYEEYLKKKGAK